MWPGFPDVTHCLCVCRLCFMAAEIAGDQRFLCFEFRGLVVGQGTELEAAFERTVMMCVVALSISVLLDYTDVIVSYLNI